MASTMERILRLMGEKKASDVYLSAHAPALIKINGQCIPINNQLLPPEAPSNLLAEVLPAKRIEPNWRNRRAEHGVPIEGVGNFRCQRHAPARLLRGGDPLHQHRHPAAAFAGRARHPGRPHHGKARPAADGGRHRRGQEHHAGSHDGFSRNERVTGHILTIEDPVEFLFKNKKSVVNQREVGTDTESHANRAEKRAAPGARRDPDWRNP
jgi:twitching motility protein PilU